MKSLTRWFSILIIIQLSQPQELLAQVRDSSAFPPFWRCYPLHEDSYAGIDFGALRSRPGVKLYDYRRWVMGVQTSLATDLNWRPRINGENYFNLELMKHRVFYHWDFDPVFSFGYKRIGSDNLSIEQLSFLPGYFDLHYGVMAGYAVERRSDWEEEHQVNKGVAFRVYKEFFDRLAVNATMIHWGDEIQYSVSVQKHMVDVSFSILIGWEQINNWNELNIAILYQY